MITFKVVKQANGWAVQMGRQMTTPYRLKQSAIREANNMAQAIGRHGECAEVVIETADLEEAPSDPAPGRTQSRQDINSSAHGDMFSA